MLNSYYVIRRVTSDNQALYENSVYLDESEARKVASEARAATGLRHGVVTIHAYSVAAASDWAHAAARKNCRRAAQGCAPESLMNAGRGGINL